ncbi:hypothetical protein XI06_16645 [Bradyrhizobium sp. CCBAU 11434]|nr:hypothetical protein [Bradyrhizobium sp. CCBAU 11434]
MLVPPFYVNQSRRIVFAVANTNFVEIYTRMELRLAAVLDGCGFAAIGFCARRSRKQTMSHRTANGQSAHICFVPAQDHLTG